MLFFTNIPTCPQSIQVVGGVGGVLDDVDCAAPTSLVEGVLQSWKGGSAAPHCSTDHPVESFPVLVVAVPKPCHDVLCQDALGRTRVERPQDGKRDSKLPQLSEVIQATATSEMATAWVGETACEKCSSGGGSNKRGLSPNASQVVTYGLPF